MIKRMLKWIFRITLGLILIAGIGYGLFHLSEYATGGKYVKYLAANSETIPLEKRFSYEMMEEDVANSKLILVGEIHGSEEPIKFDVDFFKYLHQHHNVKHYLAELDFVQALLLNEYLKTGNEDLLNDILKKWAVAQGRNNVDYLNKYQLLHQYHQQLPDDDKFEFIGIDKIQDMSLTSVYINSLLSNPDSAQTASNNMDTLSNHLAKLSALYANSPDTLFILSHIQSNLNDLRNKENRGEVMFRNFYSIYKNYGLEKNKLYGHFGLFHIFQYRVNDKHPLASNIRQSDLGLEDRILSINFLLNNSYTVMPSSQLPKFMRDEGRYTRMPVSADNLLIMYIYGIKDFKRMTPQNHKSLIKLNSDNSPYANSNRMIKSFQLLPVTNLFIMNDKGKPYVQYTVFARNSDWAEPME